MKSIIKYVPILALLALSIGATIWGVQEYLNLNQLKEHQAALELYISQHEILALLIYTMVYIAITGASIPGATFLTLAGGFLFGQIVGTCTVVIAATLGASVIFLSARLATDELLRKKTGPWLSKIQAGFKENAISYLLTLRLIPLFPFVAVNLACAFMKISFRIFFFTTLVGIIPGSFVYVSLGVAMHEVINQPNFTPNLIINPKVLLALIGLGILSLLPVLYKLINRRS